MILIHTLLQQGDLTKPNDTEAVSTPFGKPLKTVL
jgi:hypothetical protein